MDSGIAKREERQWEQSAMFTCCGANHSNHTTAFKRDVESMRVLFGRKVGFEDRFQHQHFVRRSLVSTPTFWKPLHCPTHCATMSFLRLEMERFCPAWSRRVLRKSSPTEPL